MTDSGEVHDDPKFGKVPEPLIHDLNITDGAIRLFAHMHWRYGKNKRNFEGHKSIAAYLDISRTTIRNRIDELVANDWVVVISRDYNPKTGNYVTPYYHVFVSQDECRKFRNDYAPIDGQALVPKPEARKRVSRRGKGGKPENLPRANSGEHDHANSSLHGGANSGEHGAANLGWNGHANPSEHELDSSYPDSIDLDSVKREERAPAQLAVLPEMVAAHEGLRIVTHDKPTEPIKETSPIDDAKPPIPVPPPLSPKEIPLEEIENILSAPPNYQSASLQNIHKLPMTEAYARAIGQPFTPTNAQKLTALRLQVDGYTPDDVFNLTTEKLKTKPDYAFNFVQSDLPTYKRNLTIVPKSAAPAPITQPVKPIPAGALRPALPKASGDNENGN